MVKYVGNEVVIDFLAATVSRVGRFIRVKTRIKSLKVKSN